MTPAEFDRIIKDTFNDVKKLMDTKGPDYTQGSSNRLQNFYKVGEALGVPPIVVWGVYAGKHWEAIMSYIKGIRESEPISTRICDEIAYLLILKALIYEEEKKAQKN